jgi:DNA replication protein DnaC
MKTIGDISPSGDERDPFAARTVRDLITTFDNLTPEQQEALRKRPRPDPQKDILAARKRKMIYRFAANCPPAARRSDWNHPRLEINREQINRVRSWQPGRRGLLITGPTGRGKSRSFWSLLHRLMVKEHKDVHVFQAHDFFQQIQLQMNYGRDDSAAFVKAYSNVPILALDDWGQEVVPFARENHCQGIFFQILDRRDGAGLPIIITTNLTANDIAERQGDGNRADPMLRRLVDSCEIIKFTRPADQAQLRVA